MQFQFELCHNIALFILLRGLFDGGIEKGEEGLGNDAGRRVSPFCVSLVEQTSVEIWNESLLMEKLPRFCVFFPDDGFLSSISGLVEAKLRYMVESSSFLASAYTYRNAQSWAQHQFTWDWGMHSVIDSCQSVNGDFSLPVHFFNVASKTNIRSVCMRVHLHSSKRIWPGDVPH